MKRCESFTLIEFLAVIAAISILASLILLSSSETATTAQANIIINNFANFRIAYSILYGERDNEINISDSVKLRNTFTTKTLLNYIHDVPDKEKYRLKIDDACSWYVYTRIDSPKASRIKRKLAGYSQSSGLLGSDSENLSSLTEYSNQDYVIVKLR